MTKNSDEPTLETFLEEERATIRRVHASELADLVARGAIVVDTRPIDQRTRDGAMPGAIVIDRNVLEWRLAPSSRHRILDLTPDQLVVVVCAEGYSSSLAAATLRRLGVSGAADLVGGYREYDRWAQEQEHRGADDN